MQPSLNAGDRTCCLLDTSDFKVNETKEETRTEGNMTA